MLYHEWLNKALGSGDDGGKTNIKIDVDVDN